jgi:hypothetical protein
MIDVLSTMQGVLREARFTTRLASVERSPIVCFEDDTLMGFGCVFDDPGSLLSRWKATEMSILTRFAANFRAAGEKAWNVYCIFLCSSAADSIENRQVRWIEEDLEHTRKIAGCGLASREDLVRILLPLLPLQYQPALHTEDVTERLQRRIRTIAPRASEVVLDEAVSAAEVVRLLGGPV